MALSQRQPGTAESEKNALPQGRSPNWFSNIRWLPLRSYSYRKHYTHCVGYIYVFRRECVKNNNLKKGHEFEKEQGAKYMTEGRGKKG